MEYSDKLDNIKKKLRMIDMELEGSQNNWALVIEQDELFGYIDISGRNQIVLPEYSSFKITDHFIQLKQPGHGEIHLMVRGNTHDVIRESNEEVSFALAVLDMLDSTGIQLTDKESKIAAFMVGDDPDNRHVSVLNHLGKSLDIKAKSRLLAASINNRKYSPKTGKQLCEIGIREPIINTRFSHESFSVVLDEDLNIVEYRVK